MERGHPPVEENLGKDCMYWAIGELAAGCCYPKAELEGRRSCEGIVDDVCLFIKDGRPADSLTEQQMQELKTSVPNPRSLPPGGRT